MFFEENFFNLIEALENEMEEAEEILAEINRPTIIKFTVIKSVKPNRPQPFSRQQSRPSGQPLAEKDIKDSQSFLNNFPGDFSQKN